MLSWSELQAEAQALVGDATATTLTRLKRDLNVAIRDIRVKLKGIYVMDAEYTATTVASTQYYALPADFGRVKTVSVEIDDVKYPLQEVQNSLIWESMNEVTDNTGDPPTHYYIRHRLGRDEIGLFPIPATACDTNGLLLIYIADPPDLSVDDSALTVAGFTNGDATVTHAAAGFTSAMVDDERWLKPDVATGGDGNWYRLLTFTSTSSIELDRNYEGLTDTSVSATVAQIPLLPKNTDHLPAFYAAAMYHYRKRDFSKGRELMGLYKLGIQEAKGEWGQKSTQQVGYHGRSKRVLDPNIPPRGLSSA